MHGVQLVEVNKEKGIALFAVNLLPNAATKVSSTGKTKLLATGSERVGDVTIRINATIPNEAV